MDQSTLDFPTLPADPCDRAGFELGWDHAHHGLVPPPELLLQGTPVCQGWMAGRAVFGRRTLASTRQVRRWLALRTSAWRQGIHFETGQLTPNFLAQIDSTLCPVRRRTLGGVPSDGDAAVIERLNPDAGYAAGNLATVSQTAARARAGLGIVDCLRRARGIEAGGEPVAGLDALEWTRLAVLRSFATPLPFFEAARLPMVVLPPNRVRLLNPAQGLQALVTLQFVQPGWSARARALAAMLPEHTLRHDFNLFIGAMAPRVLDAGAHADARSLRHALEDAWAHERVQRRWQHLVLGLGEAATDELLQRAAAAGLAGVRTQTHATAQATEGWALSQRGRAEAPTRNARADARWPARPRSLGAESGARTV
jgi:hypothetical protein